MNNAYESTASVASYDKAWSYPEEAIDGLARIIKENNLPSKNNIRILDIGLGTGSLTFALAKKLAACNLGCHVDGFDASSEMVAEAKKRSRNPHFVARIIHHDAKRGLPDLFKHEEYDVVIITFVLHYLDESNSFEKDWQTVLRTASASLADRGLLIQSEVLGEMGAVDGLTPVDIGGKKSESDFVSFWEIYFKLRNEVTLWNPDLRPSSYQTVFEWITENRQILSLSPFCGFFYEDEHSISLDEMVSWISKGQFSSLSSGVEHQRESLAEEMFSLYQSLAHSFTISRSARFIIHQKASSRETVYSSAHKSLVSYIDRYGIFALPLTNSTLPIKNNQFVLDNQDENALTAFLEECIISVIGGNFLDCELCLYDFLNDGQWGSIARIRPEFEANRSEYTKSIGGLSFIEKIYRKDLFTNSTPSILQIVVTEAYTQLKYSKANTWKDYVYNTDEANRGAIESHQKLRSETDKELHVYYIMTMFAPPIRQGSKDTANAGFGVGSLILVTKAEVDIDILKLLLISVSEITNPIGAAYLWAAQLRQTERAARAAVFARNFSHITGSHVISNPEFRHSLAGNKLMRACRRGLDQSYSSFIAAENDLFRFMFVENKKPEDAFSTAAKTLADVRDKIDTGEVLLENTRRFHEYLQGRFDFIARAIDDAKDRPEPVWFVKDLLEGFLIQTAYLDNIVADVGLRLEDIELCLNIDGEDFIATWVSVSNPESYDDDKDLPLEIKWKPKRIDTDKTINIAEKLVALPGGMVAAHAFYSLLENIIRNSVKYGDLRADNQKYQLTIQLDHFSEGSTNNPFYKVRIWDNSSSALGKDSSLDAAQDQLWRTLQKKLEKGFVNPTGESETKDLGMMEMQACAQLLCRPDDDGLYPGERPSHVLENQNAENKRRFNLWTSEPEDDSSPLEYVLTLNMPVLLACWTARNEQEYKYSFWFYKKESIDMLLKRSPFLFIIDGGHAVDDHANELLEHFERQHFAFPYRVLVIYKTKQSAESTWNEALNYRQIPTRRIKILECTNPYDQELYQTIFPDSNSEWKEEDAILAGYEAWLRAWKSSEHDANNEWHLWVGLERQAQQVNEAWGRTVKFFESNKTVKLKVRSCPSGIESKPVPETNLLVFDNHGNCFPEVTGADRVYSLKESTRFYQKLSGSVSPDLFRLLSRPPKDEFSSCFFIYSLMEACLTNVLVVDERLAWSLVEGKSGDQLNDNFGSDLLEHQNAGVYPVFRFRQKQEEDNVFGFYTQEHRVRLLKVLQYKPSDSGITKLVAEEGITFDSDNSTCSFSAITPVTDAKSGRVSFESCNAQQMQVDVILIHEGAMDILASQQGAEWKGTEKQLKALYQLAPMIIRTSGRGRKSQLLGEHLPFIEFTQVSSALLTARNKFSLVRSLLGSVGRATKVEGS